MSSSNTDFDAKLVDWLYGELSAEDSASFEAHLEAHPEHKAEAQALRETRSAFQELPEVEPPSALTAMLMQQAAAAAQPKQGVWAGIVAFFQPVILHPAASAMATLVLLAGVAGTLYMRSNGQMVAEPEMATSQADRPAELSGAAPAAAVPATETVATRELSKELTDKSEAEPAPEPSAFEGYSADLASPEQEERLQAARTSEGAGGRGQGFAKQDEKAARDDAKDGFAYDRDMATNAVSGGALALDSAGEQLGERSASSDRGIVGGMPAPKPAKTRAESKTAAKTPSVKAKTETANSWERQQVLSFQAAARKKHCRDAGRIANDLKERSPLTYERDVKGTPEESDCSYYITDESKRRNVARTKRSKKKARAGQGKSVPTKALAAPQEDEMAEPAQAQEAF